MRKISDKILDNIKTYILCSATFFFRKSCRLWDHVAKNSRAAEARDDNTTHAPCTLAILGYKHTLKIRITYCVSTATMVARTRLYVTLHVYCLACFL